MPIKHTGDIGEFCKYGEITTSQNRKTRLPNVEKEKIIHGNARFFVSLPA